MMQIQICMPMYAYSCTCTHKDKHTNIFEQKRDTEILNLLITHITLVYTIFHSGSPCNT